MSQKKNHITELFRLLGFITLVISGLISTIVFFQADRVTEIQDSSIIVLILTIITIIISIYWLLVALTLSVEFLYLNKKKDDTLIKTLRSFCYNCISFIFNTIVGSLAVILLTIAYTISLSLTLVVLIVLVTSYIVGKKIGKKIQKGTNQLVSLRIFAAVLFIVLFILFYNATLLFTSGINVVFDKEFYDLGDTIHLQIYPEGIVAPKIINITYGIDNKAIEYNYDENFASAPILATIYPNITTDYSYNSYIVVTYTYRVKDIYDKILLRVLPLFGEPITSRKEFIPIFKSLKNSTLSSDNETKKE